MKIKNNRFWNFISKFSDTFYPKCCRIKQIVSINTQHFEISMAIVTSFYPTTSFDQSLVIFFSQPPREFRGQTFWQSQGQYPGQSPWKSPWQSLGQSPWKSPEQFSGQSRGRCSPRGQFRRQSPGQFPRHFSGQFPRTVSPTDFFPGIFETSERECQKLDHTFY